MKRRMFRILGLFAALSLVTACDDGGDGDGAGGAGGTVGAGGAGAAGGSGEGGSGEGGSGEGGMGEGGSGEGGMGEGGAGGMQAAVQSLTITPREGVLAGSDHQYEVIATFADGTTGPAEGIEWSSSNEDIVSFADGTASFPYGGTATITASVGDVEATLDVTVGCDYPRFPANIVFNKPVAPVTWDSVVDHEGNEFPLSLRDISCSAEYKQYSSFLLIINAEWCPPCQAEIRDLAPEAEHLEELGAKIIFITLQDNNYGPINSQNASRFVSRYGNDMPSIRAGVIGSNPEEFFNNPAIIQAFPTSLVVRKRDMTVIADSRGLQYQLHPFFEQIVADVEADWSDPRASIPFMGNCGEADEEPSEPNDTIQQAADLNVGDAFSGGICAAEPDFYNITAEGAWQLDVEFTHAVGDIDIAFVGPDGRPLADRPGANSSTDNETLQGEGPASIVVYGYGGASAPYSISLTAQGE